MTEPDFITVPEFARRVSISTGQAYAMAARGEIPSHRFGRLVRIPASAIDELKEASRGLRSGHATSTSLGSGAVR